MFTVIYAFLYTLLGLLILYFFRHFLFTLNRAFRMQGSLYIGIEDSFLPTVTILVPAHNEEKVIADALTALLNQDYPKNLFYIMPLNDRSTDATRSIIDRFAFLHPGKIKPYHRDGGKSGKSAALKEVCASLDSEIIVVFDADYIPAPKLLRNLVAPFIDTEVGAVMGRVVPVNAGKNLLTRVLDLERSAGYQVDQQARMNLHLLPQYGGTVGALRKMALDEIGGFDDDILAEDTDITFKLFLKSWIVVYQNSCECYEEVPESWEVRLKQISRWARGHNQVLFKELSGLVFNSKIGFFEKIDAILLLGIFFMGPVIFLAWGLAQVVYYAGHTEQSLVTISFIVFLVFSSFGNFALFFEIGTAAFLDGFHRRIRLLPLGVAFFFVSLTTVSKTFIRQVWDDVVLKKEVEWHKTDRFRRKS